MEAGKQPLGQEAVPNGGTTAAVKAATQTNTKTKPQQKPRQQPRQPIIPATPENSLYVELIDPMWKYFIETSITAGSVAPRPSLQQHALTQLNPQSHHDDDQILNHLTSCIANQAHRSIRLKRLLYHEWSKILSSARRRLPHLASRPGLSDHDDFNRAVTDTFLYSSPLAPTHLRSGSRARDSVVCLLDYTDVLTPFVQKLAKDVKAAHALISGNASNASDQGLRNLDEVFWCLLFDSLCACAQFERGRHLEDLCLDVIRGACEALEAIEKGVNIELAVTPGRLLIHLAAACVDVHAVALGPPRGGGSPEFGMLADIFELFDDECKELLTKVRKGVLYR